MQCRVLLDGDHDAWHRNRGVAHFSYCSLTRCAVVQPQLGSGGFEILQMILLWLLPGLVAYIVMGQRIATIAIELIALAPQQFGGVIVVDDFQCFFESAEKMGYFGRQIDQHLKVLVRLAGMANGQHGARSASILFITLPQRVATACAAGVYMYRLAGAHGSIQKIIDHLQAPLAGVGLQNVELNFGHVSGSLRVAANGRGCGWCCAC